MTSVKYIGMDVHTESTSIAVRNSLGKIVMEGVIETKANTILQFLDGLRGDLRVVFEVGTWATWLYDLLKSHVTEVLVCNTRKNAVRKGSKSDRIDARKLADSTLCPQRLDQAWWALRTGLGVGPFLAGLDKYFNLLANWPTYVSPLALKIMPFTGQTFMHIVGVIEMMVGLAILTKWTRLGSYVASVWLLAIAINLASTGMFFDVAVRDVEIALAAFVLARLTETRRSALSSDTLQEQSANIVAAA